MSEEELIREALQRGYHAEGHHPRCASGKDEGCDCYARASFPARAALDVIAARLSASEQEREELRARMNGLVDATLAEANCRAAEARAEAAEGIVTTAQKLMAGLDHVREVRKANKQSTAEVDWAIGATLDLRAALAGREEHG